MDNNKKTGIDELFEKYRNLEHKEKDFIKKELYIDFFKDLNHLNMGKTTVYEVLKKYNDDLDIVKEFKEDLWRVLKENGNC